MPYRDVAPAYIKVLISNHVYLSDARGALDQTPQFLLGVHPRQKIPIAAGNGDDFSCANLYLGI
jgi:hypothetical protein